MKHKRIEKYIKWIGIAAVLLTVISIGLVWWFLKDLRFTVIVAGVLLLMCILLGLLYYLEELYISNVVMSLSELMESLIQLEEKDIFPENEDTLVSKLQNKVIKLTRILKNKEEEATAEQENMKALVSDISHQLKTPIANLKMYSHFLEDDTLSEDKRKEYVEVICICVERLNFLSESMIKVSRLESGLINLDMQKQSLNETVLKAVKAVYTTAKKQSCEIRYEEEEIEISHDRNWTSEAVFNLLDNAVKYANKGSLIYLRIRKLGMFVQIEVEDENGAIPEKEQAKVFSRFFRGSNSRNSEGVGIGLYLAREIALKQGGYMSLKTTNKGNLFSIVLYMK